MKFQLRVFRKTKNGGVIISTNTKGDIEKLKQSAQLKNAGFIINDQHNKSPNNSHRITKYHAGKESFYLLISPESSK